MKYRPILIVEAITFDELNALSSAPADASCGHCEWQGHACTKENAVCWLVPHASLGFVRMHPENVLISTGEKYPTVMQSVDFFRHYELIQVPVEDCHSPVSAPCSRREPDARERFESLNGVETLALLRFIQDSGLVLRH